MKTKIVLSLVIVVVLGLYYIYNNPLMRLSVSASASDYRELSLGRNYNGDGHRIISLKCNPDDFQKFVTNSGLLHNNSKMWPWQVPVWYRSDSVGWWRPPQSPELLYYSLTKNSCCLGAWENGVACIEYMFF